MADHKDKIKNVVIADQDESSYSEFIESLRKEGVNVEFMNTPEGLVKKLSENKVDVCIVNLVIAGIGPFQLLAQMKKGSVEKELKIVVVSRQSDTANIQNTIRAGADDFVALPFDTLNLFHRVVYHLTPKTVIGDVGSVDPTQLSAEHVKVLLRTIDIMAKTERANIHDAFMKVLQDVATLTKSNRTSIIVVDKKTAGGVVLASSDDPKFFDFPISLSQYPEVMHVVNSGSIILVEDVSRNWLTYKIRDNVKTIEIGSLMVFPVKQHGETLGVVTVRRPQVTEKPANEVLTVLQAIANVLAAHSNMRSLLRKIYSDFAQNG